MVLTLVCLCCVGWQHANDAACAAEPNIAAPPLEQSISIRDGRTRETLSLERLLAELSTADVVFLGESHTDETTHRLQLAVYQRLCALKKQQVVLALEMFQRDVQQELDDYLVGNISETTFLEHAQPWSNYQEAYRPLVEEAKRAGAPVIASNFPTSLRRRMMMEGADVMHSLPDEQRALVPRQFHPNSSAYWKRVDNAVRGHQGMAITDDDDPRLYSAQSLWDNSMGEACADALDKYPGYLVLHLNGEFHSAYWDGTVGQLKVRKPDAKIKTVSIVPTLNPSTRLLTGKPVADFVVYVEARATNVDRGAHSVIVGRELKYRFHLPPGATPQSPAPLLVWLVEGGLAAQEGMAFCKERFGDKVALVVVEPPYRALGEDYALGGRWYWPDTFAEDAVALVTGIERIWAYLHRHFPLDPDRICVAGEGTGATVAAVLAVHAERMNHTALAVRPRQYAKLKNLPLPLPEFFGDDPAPARTLHVIADSSCQDWWKSELAHYGDADVISTLRPSAIDPWERERQQSNAIRTALGLLELPPPASHERKYLLVDADSPRARHWGRLQACWHTQATGIPSVAVSEVPERKGASPIAADITPAMTAHAGVLPQCPGPFGGTTVVLLPAETTRESLSDWLAIESADPLAAASRFHRIRIATASGPLALRNVIDKLRTENRMNILIVPAAFYADVSWLRSMHSSVRVYEDQMTLHWLPGLGNRPGIFK